MDSSRISLSATTFSGPLSWRSWNQSFPLQGSPPAPQALKATPPVTSGICPKYYHVSPFCSFLWPSYSPRLQHLLISPSLLPCPAPPPPPRELGRRALHFTHSISYLHPEVSRDSCDPKNSDSAPTLDLMFFSYLLSSSGAIYQTRWSGHTQKV